MFAGGFYKTVTTAACGAAMIDGIKNADARHSAPTQAGFLLANYENEIMPFDFPFGRRVWLK